MNKPHEQFKCAVCGTLTQQCCSRCSEVFYCSAEHQKQDYKRHKPECQSKNRPNPIPSQQSEPKFDYTDNSAMYTMQPQTAEKFINAQGNILQATSISSQKNLEKSSSPQKGKAIGEIKIDKQLENLVHERQQLRANIVQNFGNFKYQEALVPVKRLVQVSKKITQLVREIDNQMETTEISQNNSVSNDNAQKQKFSFIDALYEEFADDLLYAKTFIKMNDNKRARHVLDKIYKSVQQKLDIQPLKLKKEAIQQLEQDHKKAFTLQNPEVQKNKLLEEVRKRCNLLGVLANLFYSVGDIKSCENCYVQYVKVIEIIFGPDSIETSNCYFLIGVFYMQNKFHWKALACMKRARLIRTQKLQGEKHECVTDCDYNIAVIYKQLGKTMKAVQFLEKALMFRRELIGSVSLPVAQVLETLGKVYLMDQDYKLALARYQECYVIRKRILQNLQHPDLIRISLLIIDLFNNLKRLLQQQEKNKKVQEMLISLSEHIQNSMDDNLNQFIGIDKQLKDNKIQDIQDILGIKKLIQQQQQQQPQGSGQGQQPGTIQPSVLSPKQEDLKKFSQDNSVKMDDLIQQIKLQNEEIQKLKEEKTFKANEPGNKLQQNITNWLEQKEQDKSDTLQNLVQKYQIKVDPELMSTLTSDCLVFLMELNEEIQEKVMANPQNDPRIMIVKSNFVQRMSQSLVQFKMLKKQNEFIFDENNAEILNILNRYEEIRQNNLSSKTQSQNNLNLPNAQQMPGMLYANQFSPTNQLTLHSSSDPNLLQMMGGSGMNPQLQPFQQFMVGGNIPQQGQTIPQIQMFQQPQLPQQQGYPPQQFLGQNQLQGQPATQLGSQSGMKGGSQAPISNAQAQPSLNQSQKNVPQIDIPTMVQGSDTDYSQIQPQAGLLKQNAFMQQDAQKKSTKPDIPRISLPSDTQNKLSNSNNAPSSSPEKPTNLLQQQLQQKLMQRQNQKKESKQEVKTDRPEKKLDQIQELKPDNEEEMKQSNLSIKDKALQLNSQLGQNALMGQWKDSPQFKQKMKMISQQSTDLANQDAERQNEMP